MWFVQCFDGLVPYQRHASAKIEDNVCIGDVCLLKYQGKIDCYGPETCEVINRARELKCVIGCQMAKVT